MIGINQYTPKEEIDDFQNNFVQKLNDYPKTVTKDIHFMREDALSSVKPVSNFSSHDSSIRGH